MSKKTFGFWFKENKVAIVVIPLIITIHWGWYELQKVPHLGGKVPKEMPIISVST